MKNLIHISILLLAPSLLAETMIHLTDDHIIFGQLSSEKEKLIITSRGKNLILNQGTTWDLRKEASVIEIAGDTTLILERGSKLIGNNGVLRVKDNAHFIIRK